MLTLSPHLAALLLANTSDLISLHDTDGTFRWASAAAQPVLGIPAEAVVGLPGLALVHPDDLPRVAAAMADWLSSPDALPEWSTTQRVVRGDGAVVWLESRAQRLHLAGEADELALVVVSRDITARIKAEQAAEAQQALLAAAFEESLVGMTILEAIRDPATAEITDFWLVQRNRQAREQVRLLGDFAPIGRTAPTLLQRQPTSRDGAFRSFRAVLETGTPWEGEQTRVHMDGERWYRMQVVRLQADQISVAWLDLTPAYTADHAARTLAAEARLSLATEIAGLGISERLVENAAEGPIRLSAEYARILGLPPEQSVVPVSEVIGLFDASDVRELYQPYLEAVLRGERPAPMRLRARRADTGVPITVLALVRLVPGPPARFQGAILDISELVHAEQRAFEMQAQLALATEVAGLGLSSRDIATGEVVISPAFAALYGFDPALPTVPLAALLAQTHPDDLPQTRPDFEFRTENSPSSQQVQYRIFRADNGQLRTLLASARAVPDASGKPARLVAATLDVTDLLASRAATERLTSWQRLIDGLPEILWVAAGHDAAHTQLLNRRWYEYTGQTDAVLQDQSWTKAFHPADLADAAAQHASHNRIKNGEPYELKFRLRRQDGQYRWFLSRAAPVRDATGTITNWVGLTVDIHEREVAETALRRANTDLDTFVYAAAHDLKSPIDNLESIIAALQDELFDLRQAQAAPLQHQMQHKLLAHATQSVSRFRTTLADLAQVVETQSVGPDEPTPPLDLATYAIDLVLDMESEFAAAHGLLCLDLRAPTIQGLRARHLRSLLFNLIGNALKYRSPDRPARLWLRSRRVGAAWLELSLTDNGLGLDAQRATRAFELFGRLHPGAAGGTGIGLFIVRRIVEQAGGQLRVNGRVGEGTTFSVRLPVV